MQSAIYKLKGIELKNVKRDSPLDKWFYEMVQKNVNMLTIVDISHMLRQEIYLDIAIPLAWEQLFDNPLCGEMNDGQMIELLTRVFINNPDLKEADSYVVFEKNAKKLYETYDWENNYEKEEYEKILVKFRHLFES